MKTTKEILDEAYSAAWTAFSNTLTANGIKYDDGDNCGAWIDDQANKETWNFNIKLEKCPEYGGD